MGATRRVVFAILILFVVATAWAQPHVSSRDHLADARASMRAQEQGASRDIAPRDLHSPLRIQTQSSRVVLSAVTPREMLDGDAVVARDAASLASIGFDVAETNGVIDTVRSSRGVRFIAAKAADSASLAAPVLIDARGRPSANAAWTVSRSAAGRVSLRLETRDRSLQYPVQVYFGTASAVGALSANGFHPAANATGAISGRLTDSVTSAGISDEFVSVYDSSGEFVTYGITDSNGNYTTVDGLSSGTYYVLASAYNYAAEVYNNHPCNGCNVTATGNGVAVTDAHTTANINFSLLPTVANISGQVLGNGSPLANITVVVYDSTGTAITSTSADENGIYTIQVEPGGPYYVRTFNVLYSGYVDQLYDGIDCARCDPTTGTAINVSAGTTASGVNFNLSAAGGAIAGSVHDASGAPVYASLAIYNASGEFVTSINTDNDGNYLTTTGLTAGTYYVASSSEGFTDQVYDGLVCAPCSVTDGDAVTVTAGQTTTGIDFVMTSNEARVSGRVSEATTNGPLQDVYVVFYDVNGVAVVAVPTNENGDYSVVMPDAGTYYARTLNFVHAGYVDQLYDATDCSGCPVTGGTAINAVMGTTVDHIDFSLANDGGSISGTVSDAISNGPIQSASVLFFSASNELASFGTSDGSGNYTSFNGLTTGTYYAVASAINYATQLYDGIGCNGCTATNGTAITVTRPDATTGIDFSLTSAFGRISGTVKTASNSTPLSGATVAVYDSAGTLKASVTTDASGAYVATVDAAGNYYAIASYAGLADQLYDGRTCEGCDPTTGDPIAVTLGTTTPGIDFALTTPGCDHIVLTPDTLPGGIVNEAYSETIAALNAVAPMNFAITGGSIPTGLSFAASGHLSGSPTATGTFTFSVTVTDANGCVVSKTYTVVIAASGTPTTTTLSISPSPAEYLQNVTLTAHVSPSGATGTVGFFDDATFLGNATLSGGSASIVVQFTQISKHENIVASYNGNGIYQPSASAPATLDVNQATPPINWATPAPITYPTALSSTQLNASSPLSGTFVYSPAAGTVLDAGTHTLTVTFTPDDDNYAVGTKTVQLVVNKATQTINWSNPADIIYGTPLSATQLNATVSVPGPSPAGALTYTPPAGTILNAGTQTLTVNAAETINYLPATKSVTLIVQKATPVFSNLSAPTIIIQQPTTTISGVISFGSFIPTGSVSITLNGVTQNAAIGAGGAFSATFNTAALVPPSYAISFAYAGDANFNPISATTTLKVRYNTGGSIISGTSGSSGTTFNFRVYVYNYAMVNISDPSIPIIAYGARLVNSSTWIAAPQPGNQDFDFDYQNAQGHSYLYNLKTTGFASGTYVFGYKIGNDPTIYEIGTFTIN